MTVSANHWTPGTEGLDREDQLATKAVYASGRRRAPRRGVEGWRKLLGVLAGGGGARTGDAAGDAWRNGPDVRGGLRVA
jgi:hypothetical protein